MQRGFPCEPLRVFVRRSCSGAGFGRAACAGRIRCTRPARLGTRRKARARACAGGCGPFRVFGRGLRLVGVPVCAALRGVPEGPQRGRSCGLFRVIGEGSPHPSSHALCAEMTLSNKHIVLHAVVCGMTIAPVVSGLLLSLGIILGRFQGNLGHLGQWRNR